ncbi:MAG TPA: DUF4093 domain-containing protein [Candidatus Aphodoplasma excrementigallinarum]|uniref:DUF4093 domain-containing protein n=1 Tax=Candidatus Aphodoplasma excrementigallinarum TaxID=2840673 RepID=A0A9D1NHE8_9FIRM|nr:DUF4093 domain-containing protein [Candidatus Aphodoplasma excrementigallinarum]
MLKIKEAIIVEGNYDKVKLSSIVDALILTTGGFGIFKNKEKLKLIRTLADKNGIILLTDPDRAGFAIRNYIKQGIARDKIRHAFIPDIAGKERRKAAPSKEGLLGVEGMDKQVIIDALLKVGATVIGGEEETGQARSGRTLTKADLYADGFAGGADSAEKRRALLRRLGLPQRMSANMLLEVINTALGYEAYRAATEAVRSETK